MLEYLDLVKPFLELKDKVRILSIDADTDENIVLVFITVDSEESAEQLADTINTVVKNALKKMYGVS
jgi:capsular polysaccharide biosynthesis protein